MNTHTVICRGLTAMYIKKNHDYGNSFGKVRNELGDIAILVRLFDKIYRLEALLTGGNQKVRDESIEDTLKDLANYAILELIEREGKE